ncbi:CBS domain-containing protein [Tropicimonas sp. IMCC34043]|uniref:CBS domain-containing protein n=1 Tax=Tropicimonas sp. IMCC34043 TaxID=2248760 RepID=UPI000E26F048|nr:CBS domain-containing protein [Tropicimonas sp. IMCC34043]
MHRKTEHPISHENPHTHSQSLESNMMPSGTSATAQMVLDDKGGEIYSVRPADSVHHASEVLKAHNIGAVLVRDQNGHMVGILTERDIVRGFAELPGETYSKQVEDLMTKDVITCAAGDHVFELLHVMVKGNFRHLPVMDGDHVLGVISIRDVVKFRLQELEYEALKLKQMIVG